MSDRKEQQADLQASWYLRVFSTDGLTEDARCTLQMQQYCETVCLSGYEPEMTPFVDLLLRGVES